MATTKAKKVKITVIKKLDMRELFGDQDVVRMAFLQAGTGDLNEFGFFLESRDILTSAVTHR